ncbi:transmembrane protein 18-like [Saccoglossus kowalevskii]
MRPQTGNKMATPADAVRVGEIDGILPFLSAIDWSEPFMIGLIVFHVLCLITTITTRKHSTVQAVYFFILLVLVYFSENVNEICAENYK